MLLVFWWWCLLLLVLCSAGVFCRWYFSGVVFSAGGALVIVFSADFFSAVFSAGSVLQSSGCVLVVCSRCGVVVFWWRYFGCSALVGMFWTCLRGLVLVLLHCVSSFGSRKHHPQKAASTAPHLPHRMQGRCTEPHTCHTEHCGIHRVTGDLGHQVCILSDQPH